MPKKYIFKDSLLINHEWTRKNPEDNGYLWFLSMTCPEIHLQENRENLNGISGLVTAFDLRTLLKDQDLYSPEDDLP